MPRRLLLLAAVVTVACVGCPKSAVGQSHVISLTPQGLAASGDSYQPRVSADGLRIVFTSKASNLVVGDTNGREDIFLWDGRATPATIVRLSVSTGGTQANGPSENPSISPDGNTVAFNSTATNLGAPPTGGWSNVYARTIAGPQATWATTWVSRAYNGAVPDMHCGRPSMSDAGIVAFECLAGNMIAGDTNSSTDVFVATINGTGIERVSTTSSGGEAKAGYSQYPSISADGTRVAFESYSNTLDLNPSQTPHVPDIFVKDRDTHLLFRVVALGLSQPNGSSLRPALSGDGNFVAFESQATNFTGAFIPSGTWHVFRAAVFPDGWYPIELVSSETDGTPLVGGGQRASINDDGSRVSFQTNEQIALWSEEMDPYAQFMTLVSETQTGELGGGRSVEAAVAPRSALEPTLAVWSSDSRNLDDQDTGGQWDIYVTVVHRGIGSTTPSAMVGEGSPAGMHTTFEIEGLDIGVPLDAETLALLDIYEMFGREMGDAVTPAPPTVTVGGVAALGVTTPDASTLRFCAPRLAPGTYQAAITYVDGEIVRVPVRLTSMVAVPNSATDTDHDALPDFYELQYGLDPLNAADAGVVGASGLTPVQARAQQHHPTATSARYLAEGATNSLFHTRIALANPGDLPATALLRYAGTDATLRTQTVVVPAKRRATVDVETVSGMATAEFSTAVESDAPLIVDRTLRWGETESYGAHAETAVPSPALTWYLAEGATTGNLNLFYLLQNPNAGEAQVRVRFLRPAGAPIEKTYTLPPNSRSNIWVDYEEFPGLGQALLNTDVSAVFDVLNAQPIIVERALYADVPGQFFGAGHESAGITAPALQWFLAEGATGTYFDLFVLIANPGAADAAIEATYLLPTGATIVRTYTVTANSRFNIWVDYEDAALADTAVSTTIRSTNGVPVIVERALWWPGTFGQWYEAHNSPGATSTGVAWALAEGEVGGTRSVETYILLANTSPGNGSVRVTLLFEDAAPIDKTFTVAPRSRFNVDVGSEFAGAQGKRFGAIVESLGTAPAQIVVERAMYWNAAGQFWAAGTNALATKLR